MNPNMENQANSTISHEMVNALAEDDYEAEIVKTLVGMYAAKSTEERNGLYNNLVILSENKGRFIQGIVRTMYGSYELTQKLSVVLYFKSYLNNMIIKKSLTPTDRKDIFNEFVKVMFEADLPIEVRNNLTPCLESLLFADEADRDGTQNLLQLLFETMDSYSAVDPKTHDPKILRVFFSLFRASTNIIQENGVLSDRLRASNKFLCAAASKIIEELRAAFLAGNQAEAKQNSAALQEWVMIYKESLSKTQKKLDYPHIPQTQKPSVGLSYIDFLTREDFMKISYEIILIASPKERLFFTTGDDKIDILLFNAKENIIKIVANLISYIKPHLHMKALKDTDFLKLLEALTPLFLSSLIELGSSKDNADFLASPHRCQCVSAVLGCAAQLVYIKEYHEHYTQYDLRLFTDIGFPFIRTLDEEKAEAIDNPSEFVKLGLDTCDRQRLAHMKSQAARFIETIGDKIPGFFPRLCNLCCDLLAFSIFKEAGSDGASDATQLANNYPTLNEHHNDSVFLTF